MKWRYFILLWVAWCLVIYAIEAYSQSASPLQITPSAYDWWYADSISNVIADGDSVGTPLARKIPNLASSGHLRELYDLSPAKFYPTLDSLYGYLKTVKFDKSQDESINMVYGAGNGGAVDSDYDFLYDAASTVFLVVKFDSDDNTSQVMFDTRHQLASGTGIRLEVEDNGAGDSAALRYTCYEDGSLLWDFTTQSAFTYDNWYYMYFRTKIGANDTIYINTYDSTGAAFKTAKTVFTYPGNFGTASDELDVGGEFAQAGEAFNGWLYTLGTFNYELTDAQIDSLNEYWEEDITGIGHGGGGATGVRIRRRGLLKTQMRFP